MLNRGHVRAVSLPLSFDEHVTANVALNQFLLLFKLFFLVCLHLLALCFGKHVIRLGGQFFVFFLNFGLFVRDFGERQAFDEL